MNKWDQNSEMLPRGSWKLSRSDSSPRENGPKKKHTRPLLFFVIIVRKEEEKTKKRKGGKE